MREEGRIYINELGKIVHRKVPTIRKWESDGKLPKHLLPHRGTKNWRYWTKAQVYGPRGIVVWMERNDMRPGKLISDPEKVDSHIENLRRPKYLSGHHIRSVKLLVANGKSRETIIKKIYPRTKYSKPEKLESALVKLFKKNGWEFPPKQRISRVSKANQQEIKRLENKIKSIASGS